MRRTRHRLPSVLAFMVLTFTLSLAVCQAQTVTFVAKFHGPQGSATSLIQGTDGNLYGTMDIGGAYGQGEVLRMTPAGDVTPIYSFCAQPNCPDGAQFESGLVLGGDGNLYGATIEGGSDAAFPTGSGTLFKMTLDGQITTLHVFCASLPCTDGEAPTALTQASDGNFYGAATVGGKFNDGTIFRVSPAGEFTVLYNFCSLAHCADGLRPFYPPIQGIDGNFYGTAVGGGTRGGGVFYQLTAAGAYKVLYNFCNYGDGVCDTGSEPSAIVQDADGNFFGTTVYGGLKGSNYGTIFEITSKLQYIVLHRFDLGGGINPVYGLTLANDGNLYGAGLGNGTLSGGSGTLFEATRTGEYTSFYNFNVRQGYDPFYGPLFQSTEGNIYGTTLYGPGPCCYGTIFEIANGLGPLVEMAPTAGKVGEQVLILGNGLTGSTSVTFNGVAATFTVESDTYIKASVPEGATSGIVSVVTPTGTLNSNPQFVVTK